MKISEEATERLHRWHYEGRAVQGAKISLEAEERKQSKWLRKDGFA